MPRRFDAYEVSNTMNDYKIELTDAERKYYSMMELCAQHFDLDHIEHEMVGAAIGGGFINTAELHVVTYDQALVSPEKEQWIKDIEQEHDNMKANNVWKPVHDVTT
jgi:hypothetical protein